MPPSRSRQRRAGDDVAAFHQVAMADRAVEREVGCPSTARSRPDRAWLLRGVVVDDVDAGRGRHAVAGREDAGLEAGTCGATLPGASVLAKLKPQTLSATLKRRTCSSTSRRSRSSRTDSATLQHVAVGQPAVIGSRASAALACSASVLPETKPWLQATATQSSARGDRDARKTNPGAEDPTASAAQG